MNTIHKIWNMRFHPEKCKVMHIGKEIEEFSYIMTENGQPITLDYADEEKDLGVIVDNDLSFQSTRNSPVLPDMSSKNFKCPAKG